MPRPYCMFHISDEQVQAAFDVLHSNEHAKARAAYEYSEKRLKAVLAELISQSDGKTVSEREGEALRSERYNETLQIYQSVCRAYYEARDKREAASAVIDAWRTLKSDQRAMGRVG